MRNASLVLLVCLGTSLARGREARVLFLGNSHTYYNDLPGLVASLAREAGESLLVSARAVGGYTFAYPPNAHLFDQASLALLSQGPWDWVVLQEHSQFPCIPYLRDSYMFPGANALDSLAHLASPCATTLLYMTWGHNHQGPWTETYGGYSSPPFADFDAMQDTVTAAYRSLASQLGASVAPVGVAWQNASHNGIPLGTFFQPDEYHATLAGSYLGACVFFACFFHRSPVGLSFTGGLDPSLAGVLQAVADSTVLREPGLWFLDFSDPKDRFDFTWSLPPPSTPLARRGVSGRTLTWSAQVESVGPAWRVPRRREEAP